jgi:hypothetical protein
MLIHLLYSASNMLVIYMYSVLFKWSYLLPKYVYLMLKQEFEALRCHCHCSWLALVPCLPPPLFQDLPPSISSQAHNVDPPSPAYCCTMQFGYRTHATSWASRCQDCAMSPGNWTTFSSSLQLMLASHFGRTGQLCRSSPTVDM